MPAFTPRSYMLSRREDFREVRLRREGSGWRVLATTECPNGHLVPIEASGPSIDMALDAVRVKHDRQSFQWGQRMAADRVAVTA